MLPPAYFVARTLERQETMEAVARLTNPIPERVEVGVHYCYGDPGGKHVIEPRDGGVMTDLIKRLLPNLTRPLNYIHMPVPISRHDDAYFEPFRQLELPASTEIYLGLVHLADGVAGAKRRMASAARVFPKFGIGTECGFGRCAPERLNELLTLHCEVASVL
jgi:hypothetical protein